MTTGFLALALSILAQDPSVSYTLTDQPAEDAGHWHVRIQLRGLDPANGPAGLLATGWGWPRDWPFLEVLESDPPVAALASDGSSVTLEQPPHWDGSVTIAYRVRLTQRGSDAHQRMGLVPSRGGGFAYGNSKNVLLQPTQAGEFFGADVTIDIVSAEESGGLVTGWMGAGKGRQQVVPDAPWENSPIVFGTPTATTYAGDGEFAVETFQFSGPDATEYTTELMRKLGPAMEAALGWPARSPSRVFISDAMSGGMGGLYGIHMNMPADAQPGHERSPWFETTVAHELFHEWLGTRVHESHGSLVWFREGFTEYFAQWFCASLGITSQEFFAKTLEEFDHFARESTSLGRIAFADPGVNWRDGDGPNELMAYRGAPVLALALDVELRAAGHPGLLQLVRDLLAEDDPVFPPDVLRLWFLENDLGPRWDSSIAGRDVPRATDSLTGAGFEPAEVEVDVAYLGLHTVEEKPIWHVLGVDPDGPAARAGVQEGDVIDGFFPFNSTPTRLKELTTPYTFGLKIFLPGIEGSFLGLQRDGEALKVFVEPEVRPWGLRTGWKATLATDAFFAYEPR